MTETTGDPAGSRAQGLRLLLVMGTLLVLVLLLAAWHEPAAEVGATPVTHTAVETPQAALGRLALALGAVTVVVGAWVRSPLSRRAGPQLADRADRILLAGPALVVALLLLKVVLEPDDLGIGAWLGVILGLAFAGGGFAAAKEVLGGRDNEWLLLGGAVVAIALVAAWRMQGGDDVPTTPAAQPAGPPLPAPTTLVDAGTPSVAPGDPGGGATVAPGGDRQTAVSPLIGDPGSSIVASARGVTAGRSYVLRLGNSEAGCASGVQIGGPKTADDSGVVADTPGVIPNTVSPGRHFVCFSQQADARNSTVPVAFFIP